MVISFYYLYDSSVLTSNTSGGLYGNHSFRLWTNVLSFLDSPKSHNLTREKSDRHTSTLSSFTSRWTISLQHSSKTKYNFYYVNIFRKFAIT